MRDIDRAGQRPGIELIAVGVDGSAQGHDTAFLATTIAYCWGPPAKH